jgi:hypothetical protein
MYLAGTKLLETYAVPPLLHNQVLAIGVTSYCGKLYFGINADRDAMSDVDVLPTVGRITRGTSRGGSVNRAAEVRFAGEQAMPMATRIPRSRARRSTRPSTKPNCSACKPNW